MPVTPFQKFLANLISTNRTPDSYLAGGAALNFEPNTIRYSRDLDYFHDSEKRVLSAFTEDQKLLESNGLNVKIEIKIPGYIKAIVFEKNNSTKLEWAHDSAWRFLPPEKKEGIGYTLHPIDLAINKLLALAGRDEPRDFLDIHYIHENILSLGALCWACSGKDPGFTPYSLLELLKRKGRYQQDDFKRLDLNIKIDMMKLKKDWLLMLVEAENLISRLPTEQAGCLYYNKLKNIFVTPDKNQSSKDIHIHYGVLGGILPQITNN